LQPSKPDADWIGRCPGPGGKRSRTGPRRALRGPIHSSRSHYSPTFSNIVVNTDHPDYKRAVNSSNRERETYILTAMAKELNLFNHGLERLPYLLDRVVEVLAIVLRAV
jgi:hypothetical protein